MKKIMTIVAVVAIAASFTACKKDYTCTCKDGSGDTYTYDLGKQKKGDAQDACDAAGSIWILGGGSCDLD